MDLREYFASMCRETAIKLKINSPGIKPLLSGRKLRNKTGVVGTFRQNGYSFSIFYLETGKGAYAQQTLWLSVVFDSERSIVFSVYDILAHTDPQNFNCYTYTYVDSKELMRSCFEELTCLLEALLPQLSQIAADGATRNKLILEQKEKIDEYFGEPLLKNSELLGGRADKLIGAMLFNYFEYQIECAVVGNQALFYAGKEDKALKCLKKAKYLSDYEKNLLAYIENGGKATPPAEGVKDACATKGSARHGADFKGALKLFGMMLLSAIPISAVMIILFFILTTITAKDCLYIFGIKEALIFLPIFSVIPGIAAALQIKALRETKPKKDSSGVQSPPLPQSAKTILKYFTIAVETIALFFLLGCVNSTTLLYETHFEYSTEDFPLSRSSCKYSSVDYIAVVDGYTINGEFNEDKHIVIITKSGVKLDLYNSTFFSAREFEEKTTAFFAEKGIEINHFKTLE